MEKKIVRGGPRKNKNMWGVVREKIKICGRGGGVLPKNMWGWSAKKIEYVRGGRRKNKHF